MKKRFVSFLLLILMLALVAPTAGAEEGFFSVTLDSGDTVYGLCETYGLNYYTALNTILLLNGWESEEQMAYLHAGDSILLPRTDEYNAGYAAAVNHYVDDVAYYLIPYEIQSGDTLEGIYSAWGLRLSTFENMIRMINGVDDLDCLEVGTLYYLPSTTAKYSPDGYITVYGHTMQWGETAYDVFSSYGINYNAHVDLLRRYNFGADLTKLALGDILLIPQF